MTLLSNKRNAIVVAIIFLLALVMVYVNFVQPARDQAAQKKRDLAAKTAMLQALTKQSAHKQEADPNNMLKLLQARARIPELPYEEELLRQLRMLEVVSGLQMSGYQLEIGNSPLANGSAKNAAGGGSTADKAGQLSAKAAALAVPIRISFSVSGDYDKLYRLLDETETANRLIQINQLTFNVQPPKQVQIHASKQTIKAQLSLTAYFAPGLAQYFREPLPVDYTPPAKRMNPIY
ncbi:MAG TPA: GspMb/PilO family protein [Bacilli bacterium]